MVEKAWTWGPRVKKKKKKKQTLLREHTGIGSGARGLPLRRHEPRRSSRIHSRRRWGSRVGVNPPPCFRGLGGGGKQRKTTRKDTQERNCNCTHKQQLVQYRVISTDSNFPSIVCYYPNHHVGHATRAA